MSGQEFFVRKASGLVRTISGRDALMFNLLNMGIVWTFLYIVFAVAIYPGVNMPVTVLIAAPVSIVMAFVYLMFAVSMPRSGGDYIWVSRSLHPAVGFTENFLLAMICLSFMGPTGGWIIDPGFKSILIGLGTISNNPALIAQAQSLMNPMSGFVITTVIVLALIALNFAGTKTVWRFQWIMFAFVIIGAIVFFFVMLAAGHEAFVARFNQLSGTSYDQIIKTAQGAGYNTGFTIQGTTFGIVYAYLNILGYWWSAYVGGEIKDVNRSQVVAMIGAVIIFTFFAFASYQIYYAVAGSEFVHAASYLALNGNSAWTLPMPPYANYVVSFVTGNPIVVVLVGFSVMAQVLGALMTILVGVVRMFFAWSFDRILPTRMSEVDSRHVPRYALALAGVISVVYVYLNFFTTALSYLSYAILGECVTFVIVGVAAAIFPYKRKDIFTKAPKFVQAKVGGLPLMTILGIGTVIINVVIGAFSIAPQFTGAPVSAYYVVAVILTFVIGFVIYGAAYWYNKHIGIDMRAGFREIPPL